MRATRTAFLDWLSESPPPPRARHVDVVRLLVEERRVDEEAVAAHRADGARTVKDLVRALLAAGAVTEDDVVSALARRYGLRVVDLEAVEPDPGVADLVDAGFRRSAVVLPMGVVADKVLWVAVADPTDASILEDVSLRTGYEVRAVLAGRTALEHELGIHGDERTRAAAGGLGAPQGAFADASEHVDTTELVDLILDMALSQGASDLHVEPLDEGQVRVRLRVQGECHQIGELEAEHARRMVARIKVLADLDVAEHRLPQDGRLVRDVPSGRIEGRVAVLPVAGGHEAVVMRLLAAAGATPLDDIGLRAPVRAGVDACLGAPYGLFLCVGPTGSGKTTTLHSALHRLNTEARKIWTVEDPVEIVQRGLQQVPVQPQIGRTFARILRAFLRADPDVIMVGEIRDAETARTALEASITGHLVLATLHTNSAPDTIARLLEMADLDPFLIADSLVGVLAQRLVRRLCAACRRPESLEDELRAVLAARLEDQPSAVREELLGADYQTAPGCEACRDHGYVGRLGVHELLLNDAAMRAAITAGADVDDLYRVAAASGMETLLRDGLVKARAGDTSVRQVLGVCRR